MKGRATFRCTSCDASSSRWAGRCAHCGAWNSLEEPFPLAESPRDPWECAGLEGVLAPIALADVDLETSAPMPTGVAELDRALCGGLVPGSVTLIGGEPGIGKSTLVLQMAAGVVATG